MRTLLCLLTLVVLVVPAFAGGAAPPVLPVDTVDAGTLYFGGTKLDRPYSIGIELRTNRLVVNGYMLPEPIDSVTEVPRSCQAVAQDKAMKLGPELYRNGKVKGKKDQEILEEWQARSLEIPCIGKVFVGDRQIQFVTDEGLSIFGYLPEENPKPHPSVKARAIQAARGIAKELREGHALFITPNGGLYGTDKRNSVAFEAAVEKIRHGIALSRIDLDADGKPDLDEASLLPEECQQLVRQPAKLTPAQ